MGQARKNYSNRTAEWIEQALSALSDRALYRELNILDRKGGLFFRNQNQGQPSTALKDFSSNDYLGLAENSDVKKAASDAALAFGGSSSSSRLVTGSFKVHWQLEQNLSAWLGTESCLVFGSGYHVNTGVIPALVGRNDRIFADQLCHASIIDGAILSRAQLKRYSHNDLDQLENLLAKASAEGSLTGRVLIATESVFSMDGDSPDLARLVEIAEKYNALLLVDEAHAIGVFGRRGQGLLADINYNPESTLITATLSKALGSFGGLVCCSSKMSELLVNKARSFIYSTALPPASVAAADAALSLVRESVPGARLLSLSSYLRKSLKDNGWEVGVGESHIVPLIIGASDRALEASSFLRENGFLVTAMRAPTVPEHLARLRISLNLKLNEEDCDRFVSVLASSGLKPQEVDSR